jgi:carboxyl-terminal processing protease
VLSCLAVLILVTEVFGLGKLIPKRTYDYYRDLNSNYGKYYEIMEMIGEDPIAKAKPQELSDEYLKELLASTGDPYAAYYTADEYENFRRKYESGYVGIGIGVVEEDGEILIKTVFEDSPAGTDGIKEGDVLTKIDGKKPADIDDAMDLLSGEPGTPVTVTVRRGDEEIDVNTNRARVEQDSVTYAALEDHPDIGVVRISGFIDGTADEFRDAVRSLEADGCSRYIIDLRSNGGGLTDESIKVADYLLPACRIMSENYKNGKETVYNSKPDTAGIHYVVLVDGDTASASEILTAAIQDNKGGTIIGSKTYGKGVTQKTHKFEDGSAIKITETEYFRPNGEPVNGVGVTPDVEVADDEVREAAIRELEK